MNPESRKISALRITQRPNCSSSENQETQKKKPSIDNEPQNKESHKRKTSHSKEESHRRMMLAEKHFLSSCSQLELPQKNISLEKEIQRLRWELHISNYETENLRSDNQKLRDSEASHQSVVAQLNSKLSKVRKEYGNLELSRGNLELSLSASRNRAQRRFAFQKNFLEINARNLERAVIRKGHSSAQTVIDGILSSNSLPAVRLPACNVGEDEEYLNQIVILTF
ncbi:uncharacterized protein LOC113340498 isoform X2 [Papaver somniferum]|uniref:uncharacterized protein LOC113340498 isoform X2 n=1 Tax=Papaver somniferum TaxID=3469 RepID=UPI000E705383|nr:uncharacterized protein LOC113340498 isoform X2 [Papaver somniferum]